MPKTLQTLEIFSPARAKAVKLVSLPTNIPGKRCSNCQFFDARKNGYCSHPEVRMSVNGYWGCKEWSNPQAVLVTSRDQLDEIIPGDMTSDRKVSKMSRNPASPRTDESDARLGRSLIKLERAVSRFSRRQVVELLGKIDDEAGDDATKMVAREIVTRFSDCGHTEDGDFDLKNTCASLRGKGKSGSKRKSGNKEGYHFNDYEQEKRERIARGEKEPLRYDPMAEKASAYERAREAEKKSKAEQGEKKPLFYDPIQEKASAYEREREASKKLKEEEKSSREDKKGDRDSKERDSGATNNQVREWMGQVDSLRGEIEDYEDAGEKHTAHVNHLRSKMHDIYDKIVSARSGHYSEKEEPKKSETLDRTKELVERANESYKKIRSAKSPEERKKLKAEWEGHLAALDKAKKSGNEPKHEHKNEPENKEEPKKEMTYDQMAEHYRKKNEEKDREEGRERPREKNYSEMSAREKKDFHRNKNRYNPNTHRK